MRKNKAQKTVNFYHIEAKTEIIKKVDDKLKDTFNKLKSHKSDQIRTIDIKENDYYISAMQEETVDDNGLENVWLINLSRLDPSRQINIGDLDVDIEHRNKPYDKTDRQGQVIDTQFLYNPITHICAFARTAGGVNKALLKSFLLRFCEVRGLNFAVILDEVAYTRIDKMQKPSSLTYTVASPSNVSNIVKSSRDELQDIEYANELSAGKMTMTLKADGNSKLDMHKAVAKAKALFKNSETLGIRKLELDGINDDGVFEPIDLVQHKLDYRGAVEYDNIITVRNMFDYLILAYHSNYTYCQKYK